MTYEISDSIFEMRRRLSDYEQGGVILDGDQVRQLRAELKELGMIARRQANELDRLQWCEKARRDRDRDRDIEGLVVAEATRPGTNLRLFSQISMPFSDGHPSETQ